jgi:hypothetical protein
MNPFGGKGLKNIYDQLYIGMDGENQIYRWSRSEPLCYV